MEQFILVLLVARGLSGPTPPLTHDYLPFPSLLACETAAAHTPLPPGLRLVCLPVPAGPPVLSAMH
ncbi:hypothetical protein JYK14_00180 [Siccirubricoccus sp. KC 17139]|uniref:Secreted protein n=1 Tax=Siccirubricoccus soli TaxID=2899147 RepID=A0ABT1CY57_9PROT|nr:hypothetical protein [Siccirubricoccus soli]MCO6414598.1 hypothetical protein [Siccirubricoccus soli]MCP2680728.1 hypothetical protein [Siccirubricoccus soli]